MMITNISTKRRRKPGDIAALRRTLWAALIEIEDLLDNPDPAIKIKAGHCLATLGGTYLRAIDAGDLAERIERIETQLGAANVREFRKQA